MRLHSRIIELLRDLVNIESVSGNEAGIIAYLEDFFRDSGYDVRRQKIDGERANLVAVRGRPRILFSTHLDTVPPFIPFSQEGGTLLGRGTCDAKGSLAAMLLAGENLAESREKDYGFLLVVGEETTSDGAKKAAELGLEPEFIILGEPTDNVLASAQKGTLVFKVRSEGKAGHSALPSSGRSALHKMIDLLHEWQKIDWGSDPRRGETTLNIGTIKGGAGANVIAPDCEAGGIFRLAGTVAETRRKMEEAVKHDSDLSLEIASFSEPLELTTVEGFGQKVVAFGSDAPYLRKLGKVIMAGPGSIRYAHSGEEQIELEEVEEAVDLYTRLVIALGK